MKQNEFMIKYCHSFANPTQTLSKKEADGFFVTY